MNSTITRAFRAPYAVPNGLQSTEEGLWIADQITDRVALVETGSSSDLSDQPSAYGVTKLIRDIPSESSNTSGLAFGDGSLWLAANGPSRLWRPARATDAQEGEILRVDPQTGETLARYEVPGGGGTHGVEYDHFDSGHLWVTTLKSQTVTRMRIADWSIQQVLPLPYERAHGVVRVEDALWVVHTSTRCIVKLSLDDGAILEEISVAPDLPEPHGLTAHDGGLLYCDAASGWIGKILF